MVGPRDRATKGRARTTKTLAWRPADEAVHGAPGGVDQPGRARPAANGRVMSRSRETAHTDGPPGCALCLLNHFTE